MRNNEHRDLEIFILEAAFAAEDGSDDFLPLLENLELPLAYRECLVLTVKAGRWRGKERPMQVVRAAVLRAVTRRDDAGKNRREVSGFDGQQLDSLAGDEIAADVDYQFGKEFTLTERWLPESLRVSIPVPESLQEWFVDPLVLPDWRQICNRAMLDEWETKAVLLMADGATRYGALKETAGEEEKRSLEAAWKRVERNGLKRIRALLEPARSGHEEHLKKEFQSGMS